MDTGDACGGACIGEIARCVANGMVVIGRGSS